MADEKDTGTGPWANVNDPWQRVVDERLEKALPSRRKGENKKKFRQRCMGDKKAREEFPNQGQRFQVCSRLAGLEADE